MRTDNRSRPSMVGDLLESSHLLALDQLPDAVIEHASRAGLTDVLIYIVDLQQDVLRLLPPGGKGAGSSAEPLVAEWRVDGTLAGRAFQTARPVAGQPFDEAGAGPACRWWVPMLDGTERVGVLRVTAVSADEGTFRDLRQLAAAVALLVVSKRSHSDTYARLVRTRPMTVSAEMQWNLMPPLTFANDRVVIGAALEPAYQLGGDAFDYAVTGDTAHVGIFDAMGHDTFSGLTANLAVAASRNQRRQYTGLVDTGVAIERVLIEQLGSTYVTMILADLDTRTGLLSWINHGHHPPVVIRGGRWTTTLSCAPAPPLGVDLGVNATLYREQLQPGDRILFYTDGIIEARNAQREQFGLDRFVEFIVRHNADGLPVPETLRRLVHNILDYHAGRLDDDATVLLLEWHGPPGD